MRILVLLLITLLGCGACKKQHDHKGKTPLVEVDGNFLYKEDLMSVLPVGLSKDDSILFAEHYIRSWAEEILLYEKAANNIPDNVDVDKLVENYRKALIMHTYQQELINQKLINDIPEQEIADYYEKNKELFKLENPLIKGLFIKVPLTAPQLNNVRRWYKSDKQDAVESLEKYSLQNAVKYEYFYDKWVSVTDVLDMIPLKVEAPEEYVDKARISVRNIVGSLIILAYLCFYRHTLRERKSAIFTRIQFKLFARSIKIRTSHDAFQVRTATHRTSIYTEFLH